MDYLNGSTIRRLMRVNQKTIKGLAGFMGISQVRIRYVRLHGVAGAAHAADWLEALHRPEEAPTS